MAMTSEQLSQFALVNQESKEVNILRKGITYVGRCPQTEVQISLKARVSSRRHAEVLVRDDNTVSVSDVGSSNGTFVNYRQIERYSHVTVIVKDTIGFGVGQMLPNEITEQDELPIFQLQIYSPTTPPHSPVLVIAEASLTINGNPPDAENLNENRKKDSICNDNQASQPECAIKCSDVDSVPACMAQVETRPCVTNPPPCLNIETAENRNTGKLMNNTTIPTISNHSENANMETNISNSIIDKSRIKIEDCIIEIEEDEDENIILSQAVFAPASKQAQCISQSTYFNIKQELDDFGLNTSCYAPIVDLTEENDQLLDWIDDCSDLEGCEREIAKDAKKDETTDGYTTSTSVNIDTKRLKQDSDVIKLDSPTDNIPLNVRQSNKRPYSRFRSEFESELELASVDDALIKKYLPDLKKSSPSRENSEASSSDNEHEFQNRQVNTIPSKKLKPGSNFIESRMDTKGIQLELAKRQKLNKRKSLIQSVTNVDLLNKETRSYIQKERKEKLKSLCTRNIKTRSSKEIATPSTSKEADNAHKATAKVKVSDGRGGFLCEVTNGTVQPKRFKKPPIVSPHHIIKKVKNANNGTASATSAMTSSAQDPGTLSTWHSNRPCPKISNPTRPNSSTSDTTYPKPSLSVYPNKHQHDHHPQQTALVLLPPLLIPLTPATVCPAFMSPLISQTNATTLNVHPAVSSMISWSSHSFKDYHNRRSDVIPGLPEGATGTLTHTKSWYESYEHYTAIMHPLMTIELWMNVYEDWSRAGNNPEGFCAKIDHVDIRKTYTAIQCKTFINNRDIGKAIFRSKVLLIGSYQIIDPQKSPNRSFMQLITYIQHIDKRPIHPKDDIPPGIATRKVDFVVFLTLLTKPTTATIDSTKLIKCDFVSYVSNTIKLFDAVYYLPHSPLLSTLLNPNLDDYDIKSCVNFDGPLYGEKFKCTKEILPHASLNESQRQAVLEASFVCSSTRPAVYLLDGPPGTGKTAVILQLLKQLLFHKVSPEQMRILVLAPSNGAIDNLMIKIMKIKEQIIKQQKYAFKMVRVGSLSQIHPDVRRFCIGEYAMKSLVHSLCSVNALYAQEYEFLQQQLQNLKDRRVDNCTDPEFLTKLRVTKYKIENFAKNKLGQTFHRYINKEKCFIINNCHIICSTLSSCFRLSKDGDLPLKHRINYCIVDEATQSVEQDTLIPLMLGVNKLILVGDPQQLPAIISSPIARSYGYGQSLFSRIKLRLSEQASNRYRKSSIDVVRFLDTQYRMHPHISFFPNNAFYNGRLIDGSQLALAPSTSIHYPSHNSITSFLPISCSTPTYDLTKNHSPSTVVNSRHCPPPLNSLRPYLVIRQSERDLYPSQQYGNKPEVELVVGLYREIFGVVTKYWKRNGNADDKYTVGIITPYNRQKALIEKDIKQLGIGIDQGLDLTITTVDGVQGQEKDVVIISNVRMHGNSFVENENRMNVALTRAKYVLYIVGSDNLFEESNLFREIERDAISRNLHVTIPNSGFIHNIIFQN